MIIFTTVGTSLLDNLCKITDDSSILHHRNTLENRRIAEWNGVAVKSIRERLHKRLINKEPACAEIDCVLKIKDQYINAEITVRLLCSDSVESWLCGEVIQLRLEKQGMEVQLVVVQGLVVDKKESFEKAGLKNLYNALRFEGALFPPHNTVYNLQNPHVVYNITGGYKAVIPFLTIFAQMSCAPIFYIFEKSDQLLRIPQLPVTVDFSALLPHKTILRRLGLRKGDTVTYNELERYAAVNSDYERFLLNFIEDDAEQPYLNVMGEFFLNELERTLYNLRFFCDESNKTKQKQLLDAGKRIAHEIYKHGGKVPHIDFDPINHIKEIGGFFISKQQNPHLLRLAYKFDDVTQTISVYDYIFANTDHDGYEARFKRSVQEKNSPLYSIPPNRDLIVNDYFAGREQNKEENEL